MVNSKYLIRALFYTINVMLTCILLIKSYLQHGDYFVPCCPFEKSYSTNLQSCTALLTPRLLAGSTKHTYAWKARQLCTLSLYLNLQHTDQTLKKNCIYESLKYFILQLRRNIHQLTDCLAAVRNMKYSSFDLRPCSNVPADWLQSLAILPLHMSLLGLRLKYRYS